MPGREIASKSESEIALINVSLTDGTVIGSVIDLQRSNAVLFVIQSGTVTDGSHAFSFEESIDQAFSVPIVVPESDLRGAVLADLVFDSADDNIVKQVSVVNNKRFLRIVSNTTGASTGGLFNSIAIRQDLSLTPTT